MAKVTKKTAKKKKTTRKKSPVKRASTVNEEVRGVAPLRILSPSRVQAAIETLQSVVDAYRDAICDVEDDGELSQDMISIAASAQHSKGVLNDIWDLFAVNALRLQQGAGQFQSGALKVEFDLTKGRRTVKWQALAVSNRRELCEATGTAFDDVAYVDQIKTNAKPSPDKFKPVIREDSAG